MTFPQMQSLSEEEKAAIRAQFQVAMNEVESESPPSAEVSAEPAPPRRRRGRPPGSKNRPKPTDYAPVNETPPTLATPPLTTRDQREVATRLAGILSGVTGVASVVRPYFQMTDDEANAIAIPLTSYLIRTESTSGMARQILDEYDVAAFVIAAAAYLVRVYRDFDSERKEVRRANRERIAPEPSVEILEQRDRQSQIGEERDVSREHASASESSWVPSAL